jgi:hypothetical protein
MKTPLFVINDQFEREKKSIEIQKEKKTKKRRENCCSLHFFLSLVVS